MKKNMENSSRLKALSEKIRILRVQKGLTQKQLAEILGSSPQSVSGYENGNVTPDIACLYKYADYFHVSMIELLNGTSEKGSEIDQTPSSSEMQMLEAYRRRPDEVKRAIRVLCFNGSSFRSMDEELADMEAYIKEQKNHLRRK